MDIRKISTIAGAVLIAGCLMLLATSQFALGKLKVNGPVYAEIVLGKDLVADILPPPEYIIEPYLEATLAFNDPTTVEARTKRLAELRKFYDQRHDYWVRQTMDEDLRRGITEATHGPAMRFWSKLEEAFLPALKRGDKDAAAAAYADLTKAYEDHRGKVDDLVTRSNAFIARTEAEAKETDSSTMMAVWSVSALMLCLLLAAIYGQIRGIVGPLNAMTATMRSLARGKLDIDVPFLGRKDEIGEMADTLLVFRDALVTKRQIDEQTTTETRVAALTDFREIEEWIKRENPSFEEIKARTQALRDRHLIPKAKRALAAE